MSLFEGTNNCVKRDEVGVEIGVEDSGLKLIWEKLNLCGVLNGASCCWFGQV